MLYVQMSPASLEASSSTKLTKSKFGPDSSLLGQPVDPQSAVTTVFDHQPANFSTSEQMSGRQCKYKQIGLHTSRHFREPAAPDFKGEKCSQQVKTLQGPPKPFYLSQQTRNYGP
jgi:hypothetical protein